MREFPTLASEGLQREGSSALQNSFKFLAVLVVSRASFAAQDALVSICLLSG